MRSSAPPLLPIFRSQLQGELLAAVLLSQDEQSISDLAARLDAPVATVQREVTRLAKAGILTTRRTGHMRLVRGDRSSPIIEPLTDLVLRTFGPVAVLAHELGDVAGVEGAEIFGSWAARYQGESGGPPGDIDVLVIGQPDRDELYDAALRAERALRREVNTVIVSRQRWNAGNEPFLRGVRTRPRVRILGRVDGEDTDGMGSGTGDDSADARRR
jgi:hypothetical protein